jgi:hypothetical protein
MKLGLKSTRFALVFALTLGALSAGCTKPSLVPPPGFAAVGAGDEYSYRATSAQGVVVAARVESNKPAANVDFWARAIDLRLKRDGYTFESDRAVKSAQGLDGKQLRYTRTDAGRTYRYWLSVFVAGDRVYVVEAAGDKEDFDASESAIERALLSLKTG